MPLPSGFPPFIFGIHDPGPWMDSVQSAGRQGWVLYTEELRENTTGRDYRESSSRGFGVLVRLNWGYGEMGTIPAPALYDRFADNCRQWVANSPGARIWIIANEMNLAAEWPGGPSDSNKITPQRYADCFARCRAAIHSVPGHADDLVVTGAVAPYNNQTAYAGNPAGDWVQYFRDILVALAPDLDGISLHAYTHGPQPSLVHSDATMLPPFASRNYHFRTYRDFLHAVPDELRGLPVFLTETQPAPEGSNPCQNGGWLPAESAGWASAAYREIHEWNATAGNQPIQAMLLFRWQEGCPSWAIADKDWVKSDFAAAIRNPYAVIAPRPAPSRAYRATFLNDSAPPLMNSNDEVQFSVTIRNDGNFIWRSDGVTAQPVRFGFRWFNAAGAELLTRDGARTPLPRNVPPGETVTLGAARVIAPPDDGALTLQLDLVEEGVTWFSDVGSTPRNRSVTVRSGAVTIPEREYAYTVVNARVPDTFARDAETPATLTVRNDGLKTWRAAGAGPVTLGFSWYRPGATQETLVRQLVRAALPRDVSPGDNATIAIPVLAPFSPGAYELVFDLVEEGVTSFRDAGATPFRKAVQVTAPPYFASWLSATVPSSLRVDQRRTVNVSVRNDGGKTWRAAGEGLVRLTTQWFDRNQELVLVREDIRAELSRDVAPGEAVDVSIDVLAPERPGALTLRFDLVEEGVTAFQAQGSPPLDRAVSVTGIQEYQVNYGDVYPVVGQGAAFVFNLRLRNDGTKVWAAGGRAPVKIGYHWFTADGQPVPVAQDVRTSLPADMMPGDELIVPATGFAPDAPGRYRLQWSLVAEGVAWFYDLRARTLDVTVDVAPLGAPMPSATLPPAPSQPDAAYRAALAPVDFVVAMDAASRRIYTIKLRNDGSRTWRRSGDNPVHVGYQWLQGGELVMAPQDIRTELPADMPPGAEAVFGVTVVAPEDTDTYTLRIDLVEEGLTWFADTQTSRPLDFAVQVRQAGAHSLARSVGVDELSGAFAASGVQWTTADASAATQWLQADLGQARTFDAVQIKRRGSTARGRLDVLVSADGAQWVTVGAADGSTTEATLVFAPVSARYLRIAQAGASLAAYALLAVRPARAWRAIASHSPERVSLAFDNRIDTAWTTGTPAEPGMYFTLDLGAVQSISRITLDNGAQPDYPPSYIVQVSADGQQWNVVAATRERGGSPVDVNFAPQLARYLSIECTGANRSRPWTISELRVARVVTDWEPLSLA